MPPLITLFAECLELSWEVSVFGLKWLKFAPRGSAPHPAGALPQTPFTYHLDTVTVARARDRSRRVAAGRGGSPRTRASVSRVRVDHGSSLTASVVSQRAAPTAVGDKDAALDLSLIHISEPTRPY